MAEEFSGKTKGWLSRLPRWARILLLGLLSVLITKAYESLVDGQTLERAVAYQEQALASLQTVTPQATWLLFRQSLGYNTSAALKKSCLKAIQLVRPSSCSLSSSSVSLR